MTEVTHRFTAPIVEGRGGGAAVGGGMHILGIRKATRQAIGKDVGDDVEVTITRDTAPRTVTVPEELIRALEGAPEAAERFESMSYTHRREYAEWVAEGKKQETRDRRASRAVDMIVEGRTR